MKETVRVVEEEVEVAVVVREVEGKDRETEVVRVAGVMRRMNVALLADGSLVKS